MNKRVINDSTLKKSTLLSDKGHSKVYRLRDGSILKVFDIDFLRIFDSIGLNFEQKILDAKKIPNAKEILIPTAAAYKDGSFLGYVMPSANGVDYNTFDDSLSLGDRVDLFGYAKRHHNIENVLVRAENVVFPDLCTCDNIFIDKDGRVQFIDYDGLQVDGYQSHVISGTLGAQELHYTQKYRTGELFNKNLDKKSSIYLYFISALNVSLANVGRFNPFKGKNITIEDIFRMINLDDPDICHKVWKVFQENEENEFLRDDVFKIAEKYNTEIIAQRNDGVYIKRLVKK